MTEAGGPIRVLLVDDHAVVRMGLASLFATVPGCVVVGEAGTAAEAVELARRQRPDVVLMDVRLPGVSGIEACREIRAERPEARVLMLTSFPDADLVVQAIVAGAAGYLLKRSQPAQLIEAVRHVAAGGSLLDPAVTSTVVGWMQQVGQEDVADPLLRQLSAQERKVLPLLAAGKTNREIAAQLFLSEYTVKTHVSNILGKLGLSRRAEAAALMARYAPPPPETADGLGAPATPGTPGTAGAADSPASGEPAPPRRGRPPAERPSPVRVRPPTRSARPHSPVRPSGTTPTGVARSPHPAPPIPSPD